MRFQFTLKNLLISTVLLCVPFTCVHFLVKQRATAGRKVTGNFMRQVVLSLLNFESSSQELPRPDIYIKGKRRHFPVLPTDGLEPYYSWRHDISGFLVGGSSPPPNLWIPWNNTESLADFELYYSRAIEDFGKNMETRIFAITGPGTVFGDSTTEEPLSLWELNDEKKVDDDTILIVEVNNSGVHWMEPGDFDIRTMSHQINGTDKPCISGRDKTGFHVGFADAEVWFIRSSVPFDTLSKFFTVEGAKKHDREKLLGPYAISR